MENFVQFNFGRVHELELYFGLICWLEILLHNPVEKQIGIDVSVRLELGQRHWQAVGSQIDLAMEPAVNRVARLRFCQHLGHLMKRSIGHFKEEERVVFGTKCFGHFDGLQIF